MYEEKNEELEKYKLILDHCLVDLKGQDERKVNVDTKTSYILVVLVFLLGIILEGNIGATIIGTEFIKKGVFEIIFRVIMFLCYLADIVFCLISIFFFVNVLINKKYTKISTKLWNIKDLEDAREIDVVKGLISNYTNAIEDNSKVNDGVMKSYKNGIIFFIIAIFFTIGICIINIFL